MTVDHGSDEIFDWRIMQDAAREHDQRRGDRKGRVDRDERRRSSHALTAPRPARRAQVMPFPLSRRRPFVARLAAQIASRPMDAGEAHLLQQLARQHEVLRRKGVPERAIDRELRSLTAAVRAELWRLLLGSGA
jgi:hypothetical protein